MFCSTMVYAAIGSPSECQQHWPEYGGRSLHLEIAVYNTEETYVLCHCARPFIFIAYYMFNQGKRHDWNIVDWNVEQWRRVFKHLVMFQAFVAETSVSRVLTSVKAEISEPLEQPTLCFDKSEWTSKIEFFDHWTFNICVYWCQWLFTICR